MVFLSGPRQSGKSALAKMALPNARYSSYDAPKDFGVIQRGGDAVSA